MSCTSVQTQILQNCHVITHVHMSLIQLVLVSQYHHAQVDSQPCSRYHDTDIGASRLIKCIVLIPMGWTALPFTSPARWNISLSVKPFASQTSLEQNLDSLQNNY